MLEGERAASLTPCPMSADEWAHIRQATQQGCVVVDHLRHGSSRVTPLRGDELGVGPIGSDQVGVASTGDHLPVVEHDHAVG